MTLGGPIRTCIGCGNRDSKQELLRFVLCNDHRLIQPDPPACRPGRGVYLHREAGCIERGLEPRRLARAFRGRVEVPTGLADEVLRATEQVAM